MKKLMLKMALSMLGTGMLSYIYDSFIYPKMDEYVKKTNNKKDDKALKYVDGFFKEMIADYES